VLLAAEAASAAAGAHQRAGRTDDARFAWERAAALAAGCAGAQTPLLNLNRFGEVLTPREREVAALAAVLPNREIADRLGLSVNTVNNTLSRAFPKLGITNRKQLAGMLCGAPCRDYR
jgi:DNA-binding CsgD family transcriptional regulator